MANTPSSQGRTVIIPPGVLNPDQLNVIQVPRAFANTNAPLLVTPARRGLRAQALPIWNDQLSEERREISVPAIPEHGHFMAQSPGCTTGSQDDSGGRSRNRNVLFDTTPPQNMSNVSSSRPGTPLNTSSREASSKQSGGQLAATTPPRDMSNISSSGDRSKISATSPPSGISSVDNSRDRSNLSATTPSRNRNQISATSPPSGISGVDSPRDRSNLSATTPPRDRNQISGTSPPATMSNVSGSRDGSNLSATTPPRYMTDSRDQSSSREMRDAGDESHLLEGTTPPPFAEDVNYNEICAAPSPCAPRITHVSSRTMRQVDTNPPESRSFEVDASVGINEHAMRNIIRNAASFQRSPRNTTFTQPSVRSPAANTTFVRPAQPVSPRPGPSTRATPDPGRATHGAYTGYRSTSEGRERLQVPRIQQRCLGSSYRYPSYQDQVPREPPCEAPCGVTFNTSGQGHPANATYYGRPGAVNATFDAGPGRTGNQSLPRQRQLPITPGNQQHSFGAASFNVPANATFARAMQRTRPAPRNLTFDQQEDSSCEAPCSPTSFTQHDESCQAPCSPTSFTQYEGVCNAPCSPTSFTQYEGVCNAPCSPTSFVQQDDACNAPCSPTSFVQQDGACHAPCNPSFAQPGPSAAPDDHFTLSSIYDSSEEYENSRDYDMMANVMAGHYNVITRMPPSPPRLCPPLTRNWAREGFQPGYYSTPGDREFVTETSLPSTIPSQEWETPSLAGRPYTCSYDDYSPCDISCESASQ